MTGNSISLSLDLIQADTRAQSRAEIDIVVVGEYAEDMKAGAVFPPLVVFYDETTYWLAEGFHRYHAYQQAEMTPVPCVIKPGGLREAILQSLGSNADHGKRRSNADKRRAVEIMLKDAEWGKWANREIARRCAVAESLVRSLRDSHCVLNAVSERTYTTKHGTTATMQTGNIGKKVESVEPVSGPLFVAPGETPEPMFERYPELEDDDVEQQALYDADQADWVQQPESYLGDCTKQCYGPRVMEKGAQHEFGTTGVYVCTGCGYAYPPGCEPDAVELNADHESNDEDSQEEENPLVREFFVTPMPPLSSQETESAPSAIKDREESPRLRPLVLSDEETQRLRKEREEKEYFEQCLVGFFHQLNQLISGTSVVVNEVQVAQLDQYQGHWDRFSQTYRHTRSDVLRVLTALHKNLPTLIKKLETM